MPIIRKRTTWHGHLFVLVLLIFCLVAALPARAMSVLPLSLEEIVTAAQIAFEGTCTANFTGRDAQTGLVVTYTTFDVHDVLKGGARATHIIKQVGGYAGADGYHLQGVPGFAVGQDYVVFLYGVSSAGFSSPVGLSQGQFVLRPGADGPEVSNGRDFREMLSGSAVQHIPQATLSRLQNAAGGLRHLGLDEFKELVRQQNSGTQ
jgi:hypothetical protein